MSSNFSKDVSVSTPSAVAQPNSQAQPAIEAQPLAADNAHHESQAPESEVAAPAPAQAPSAVAAPRHADTLYVLSLSRYLGDDYVTYAEDVMRMVTIQCIIQVMYYMRDPSLGALINTTVIELLLYIVLGVSFYWLVVRKLVRVI